MSLRKLAIGLLTGTAAVALAVPAGSALTFAAGGARVAERAADAGTAAQLLDPTYVARGLCGAAGKKRSAFFKPGILLAAAGDTAQQAAASAAEDDDVPLWNFLGDLSYSITTKDEMAQRYFDQGLRLSYAFNHPEALRAFRKAQEIDPGCAMCYWAEAFALGPNINAPMPASAVEPAFAAVSKAQALAAGATDREKALIAALAKRYSPDPEADRGALNEAYADAMAEVAADFPEDHDIAALYADSVMNVSPWDYWEADHSTPKGRVGNAIEAVEGVLAENPDHPFAIHLYIHLVEASTTPERAEPYADRLGGAMPGAGHMVHMPGHIYFRVGRYLDALASNHAAVAADEFLFEQVEDPGLYAYSYYPHNVHFLLESARLAGDRETALEAAEKLPGTMSDEVTRALPWVQIIAASPYFAHAQFSDPETTLAVPEPAGDEFPYLKAMWHYARGVAQAARGDEAAARAEADAIAEMEQATDWTSMVEGGVPAPDLLRLARHVVAGRIAQAKGDYDAAAGEFEEAAAIQDALPYLEPPYWYYPVRQSQAAALLQAGKAEEAERVFQRSLIDFPNNAWSLYGLMEAQKARGDEAGADGTGKLLEAAFAGDDGDLDLSRL
jgi:tetratricopeptide (TPR) repeat protein